MRKPDWTSPDGAIQLHCCDCLEFLPQLEPGSFCELRYFEIAVRRIEAELNRFPLFEPKPAVQLDMLANSHE